MAAFRLAAEMGADGIEFDVHLTRDGEVVVMHDADVSVTTDGQGHLPQMTLAEVQQLDAGRRHGPAFAGEPVPTLAQVLQELGPRLLMNIELKAWTVTNTGLEAEVIRLVEDANMTSRVLISSFNPLALRRARRLNPNVWRGLLWRPGLPFYLNGPHGRWLAQPHAYHPFWEIIDRAAVEREHQRGLAVNAWTCNEPEGMRRLAALGVDAIMTDRPDVLAEVLRAGPG